jgi:hypothetical protein
MTRETVRLISRLSRILRLPSGRVIDQAVYRLAYQYDLAGVAADWRSGAIERFGKGWLKQQGKKHANNR